MRLELNLLQGHKLIMGSSAVRRLAKKRYSDTGAWSSLQRRILPVKSEG